MPSNLTTPTCNNKTILNSHTFELILFFYSLSRKKYMSTWSVALSSDFPNEPS